MDKRIVYRALLAELRGEHWAEVGESHPLKADCLDTARNLPESHRLTDEFDLIEKSYLFEKGFISEIQSRWPVTEAQIIERGLCELPTRIENMLISRNLRSRFGDAVLALPVFENGLLKYDRAKFRRGFMRPIRDGKSIVGFEVFRHIKDTNPIAVKDRLQIA